MADVHVGAGLARLPGGVTMTSGTTDPPPVDDVDDRHVDPDGNGEETTALADEAEAMTPPRSGSSSRRITTPSGGGGWTPSGGPHSGTVRSRSVAVGAVVVDPQPPQSPSRGMDDDREVACGGDDSAAATTTGEVHPRNVRPPVEDAGDGEGGDETATGEEEEDDGAGPSITIEGGPPLLNQDTDAPNVRPPEEEEHDAALLLEAEVLRLRLDEVCRALRLLTRQVSRFPAPEPSGKDQTGSTATDGDGDGGRRRPSAAAAAPSELQAGRPRPELGENDGALRERTNAASDVKDGSGSCSGNRYRQKSTGADAVETKEGDEREVTPRTANGRPKKKSPSIRLLTSPMGKFKKSKASPLPPPPPPPFSAPPVPTASSESSSRRSVSHTEDYNDDYLALDREVELCLHLLQCDDEDLLLRHRRRRKQSEPAVGEDDVAATTHSRGYAELSNLRNACLRMRECLRQTSVESDAALSEVRRLRDESVASRRRTVDLERAVCRLHRENAALRSRVERDRRERRNVLRALRDYVSNVKSKRRMLEEEVTRTNVLMHEWALGGRMGGGGAGDGVPSSPGGTLLAESSPARSSSSVAGDDEDMSSEISFCSSVSSLATSSSSVASSRSRVTDEGVAAVRLFEASESSAAGGDACSAAASAKEKFRKRRMLHAAAAAGEGRPVYRLTFARGEKIGLQFQRVAIASIPRDVLVGGVGHTEKEGGGLGEAERAEAGESHPGANPDGEGTSHHQEEDDWFQEDDGPWPMPRSRTSTLDDGPRSRTSTLDDVCIPRSRASTLEEHDAADLLAAVAAASSSSASSDHGHDGHRCQQQPRQQQRCQQPALDAFLVCGYRGFVDRGAGSCQPPTRRRPTLGARLIAVNGESLEVGHWTFEDLRAALQAHMAADTDHVVELTFRNDQLTRRQKELLNRAVSEVEMSRSAGGVGGGGGKGGGRWTGTLNHVEYGHHPRGHERKETFDHRLDDDGGSSRGGGKDGVRDRMRKFSEELFKSSADDDTNRENSTAPPPAGASVEREEHRTTRERMRKFSEELFKTSPEDEGKKETAAHIPQAAPSTPSEKECHKASSGADSVKEKMMDLFKSSSGSSSNDRDDAKKDTSITASLFETPKKDEGGGSQGSSSDSVKEKMRKFSEGLSSTFKQLDEESRRDKTHHADSVENIPAQGEGKESALKAKMPNFEFSPKFKKFF